MVKWKDIFLFSPQVQSSLLVWEVRERVSVWRSLLCFYFNFVLLNVSYSLSWQKEMPWLPKQSHTDILIDFHILSSHYSFKSLTLLAYLEIWPSHLTLPPLKLRNMWEMDLSDVSTSIPSCFYTSRNPVIGLYILTNRGNHI